MAEKYEWLLAGEDAEVMVKVVNAGIDSRLEGITTSSFGWVKNVVGTRLGCNIAPQDMPVVLRRLGEMEDEGDDNAGSLLDSILEVEYGVEG